MDFLNDFLVLIVMGVCLCVGYIIKKLFADKVNRFIPLIMGIIGVFINIWLNGFKFTPEILLSGLVSGLASTGMHQAFKQFIDKNKEK
jgi:hypothetical protein